MIPGSEGPTTAGPAHDSSDDTIELELAGEQTLALSDAVSAGPTAACPDAPSPMSSVPEYGTFASRRVARIDFVCNVTCAVAVLGIAVLFFWPASNRNQHAPAVMGATALISVAPPKPKVMLPGPAEPQGAPVRIRNAFDSSEVFEFPHGTTESEAREAVAELLLSRARDRRAAAAPTIRRAGNLQENRGATGQSSEDFGTESVARVKEPINATD